MRLQLSGAIPTLDRRAYALRATGGIAPDGRPKSARSAFSGPGVGMLATPVLARADLTATERQGPLIVEEYDGTTVVPPDATARLDDFGNIVVALPDAFGREA